MTRTFRLAILGESPCQRCWAQCCKQNGHDYAVLLEGDERRKFAPFSIDARIGQEPHAVIERVIPYREGRCPFLGEDDRCTIYEDRPVNCRRFQCIPDYHFRGADRQRHGPFLERNPRVRQMLETL